MKNAMTYLKRAAQVCMPVCLLVTVLLALPGWADNQTDNQMNEARQFMKRYMAMEKSFNARITELYDNAAIIQNIRRYPSGEEKVITIPAPTYKQLIETTLPLARNRQDSSKYREVQYQAQDGKVRITATRHSNLKNYDSPISWVIGPNAEGKLVILEEHSESRP